LHTGLVQAVSACAFLASDCAIHVISANTLKVVDFQGVFFLRFKTKIAHRAEQNNSALWAVHVTEG